MVFSDKSNVESPPLYVRTFRVDPNTLLENLNLAHGRGGTNRSVAVATALRDYFAQAGADLDPARNPGKSIFFNDRQGMLIVRATLEDLDIIEAEIAKMNSVPPQINIKAKFVAVSAEDTQALGFD